MRPRIPHLELRRRAALACAALASAAFLAACGGGSSGGGSNSGSATSASQSSGTVGQPVATGAKCTARQGGTLTIATANPFPSLDFTLISIDTVGWDNAEGLVFDRLAEPTPDLKGIVYKLATNTTHNANFTKWTIQLRPGVKFNNGQPFTSKDVVFSLKYQLAGPSAYVLGPVASVKAAGPL